VRSGAFPDGDRTYEMNAEEVAKLNPYSPDEAAFC